MNNQYDNPGMVDRNSNDMNKPDANSNPIINKVPIDAPLVNEASGDKADVHAAQMDEKVNHEIPLGEKITHEAPVAASIASSASLLNRQDSELMRTRWNEIQAKFVDEPRAAVQMADGLVSEVISKITQMFSNEHSTLESQWKQGNDVSTEDLRKALQHYRSFFNRLVG